MKKIYQRGYDSCGNSFIDIYRTIFYDNSGCSNEAEFFGINEDDLDYYSASDIDNSSYEDEDNE
jgi:hypothetical protein